MDWNYSSTNWDQVVVSLESRIRIWTLGELLTVSFGEWHIGTCLFTPPPFLKIMKVIKIIQRVLFRGSIAWNLRVETPGPHCFGLTVLKPGCISVWLLGKLLTFLCLNFLIFKKNNRFYLIELFWELNKLICVIISSKLYSCRDVVVSRRVWFPSLVFLICSIYMCTHIYV